MQIYKDSNSYTWFSLENAQQVRQRKALSEKRKTPKASKRKHFMNSVEILCKIYTEPYSKMEQ